MKKAIRLLILFIIALLIIFETIATINMILNNEEIKNIIYGNIFTVNIIAVCITIFILLGEKKKR